MRTFMHHTAQQRVSPNRRPKTEDFNQLNEMCWNAFFNAKTMKSIRSSFCSFTRLKLQNEDLRQNALFDAENWNRWGLRVVVLPTSNYKMKIPAKRLYLTLKHWNRWGLRFEVLPASTYITKTLSKMPVSILWKLPPQTTKRSPRLEVVFL